MGTRATVTVTDEKDRQLVRLYVHGDGYWSECGRNIKAALGQATLRDFGGETDVRYSMGDAAAELVRVLKVEGRPGHVYIEHPDFPDQGYDYRLSCKDGRIWLTAPGYPKNGESRYDGPLSDFDPDGERQR